MLKYVVIVSLCIVCSWAEYINLKPVGKGYLFEGDMVLSKAEIDVSLAGGPKNLSESKHRRWPYVVVPYVIAPSLSTYLWRKNSIKAAMKEWEEKTCIRFKERTNEKDYVEFIADSGKCYSNIGRVGGKQRISLGLGCFGVGTAMHEIGHALGMWHEQSRPDRDDYVEIIWDNIKEGMKYNFRNYTTPTINNPGSPYDYDSIMHYERFAFSKFRYFEPTIRSKNGAKFGQKSHVSDQDAIQIHRYYECYQ